MYTVRIIILVLCRFNFKITLTESEYRLIKYWIGYADCDAAVVLQWVVVVIGVIVEPHMAGPESD